MTILWQKGRLKMCWLLFNSGLYASKAVVLLATSNTKTTTISAETSDPLFSLQSTMSKGLKICAASILGQEAWRLQEIQRKHRCMFERGAVFTRPTEANVQPHCFLWPPPRLAWTCFHITKHQTADNCPFDSSWCRCLLCSFKNILCKENVKEMDDNNQ